MSVPVEVGYVVHYKELDHQGGYWSMDPKGPYDTLEEAARKAYALQYPRSGLSSKRYKTERIRGVRICLRTETEVEWVDVGTITSRT